jgi:glycosyltransferase involved in cell wall biosynthesis
MSLPLVSIVLATYNGEKFIRQQLDSVINQTYHQLEITISDDGSTDNTWEILKEYQVSDPRIRIIRNEKNLGYTRNFEQAIQVTQGEYVSFCDQDDVWIPEKIEKMMRHIPGFDLCFSDSELIDENGSRLNRQLSDLKNVRAYTNCLPFVIGNCVPGHACLIKRSTLLQALPFPDAFVYDWWLAFFVCCAGKMIFLDEPLVLYRQHTQNAVAAVKVAGSKKVKLTSDQKLDSIRTRMKIFSETAARFNIPEREILENIAESYHDFSWQNNLRRSAIFFRKRQELLALKKRSEWRKFLFCIKMFFTII